VTTTRASKPAKIADAVQLEVVDDEQIAGAEDHELAAHAQPDLAVERQEELQRLVPGGARGVLARGVVEELDREREIALEPDGVAPPLVELPRDVVRFERQALADGPQPRQPVVRARVRRAAAPRAPADPPAHCWGSV
jgi:hypothetical protein